MDIFDLSGDFLALDYIHDKKRKIGAVRGHDSNIQEFNFWAKCECLYVSMPVPAHVFLLIKWKSSICSTKNCKSAHGVLLAFFVIRPQTSNIKEN